jgi:hypothetical protein
LHDSGRKGAAAAVKKVKKEVTLFYFFLLYCCCRYFPAAKNQLEFLIGENLLPYYLYAAAAFVLPLALNEKSPL